MSLRAVGINLVTGYTGTAVLLATGILTKIVLTRLVVPGDLGIFIAAQTIVGFASFAASLGLADAVVRSVAMAGGNARPAAHRAVSVALRLTLPVAIVLAAGLLGLANGLGAWLAGGKPAFVAVLATLSVFVPLKIYSDTLGAAFQGLGKYWIKVAAADVAPPVLFLVGVAGLLLAGRTDIRDAAVTYVGAAGCAAALLLLSSRSAFHGVPLAARPEPKDLLRFGLPLLGSGIVAWPVAFVPVAIGGILDTQSVAYYSLALTLASPIYLGTGVAEAATIGVWSAYVGEDRRDTLLENYRLVTRWGFIVASVVFVPLFFDAGSVVTIFFGDRYLGTATLLRWIALVYLVNAGTGPNESVLKAVGATRWIFATRLAVGAAVLVTLYPFVALYSLEGAAAAFALQGAVLILMYGVFLYRKHQIHPFDESFLRTIAAAIVAMLVSVGMAKVLVLTEGIAGVATVIAGYVIALGAMLSLLGAITQTDRRIAARLAARLRA